MEIDAYMEGVEESLEVFSQFVEREERALKEVLEFILRSMVNYVKDFGPWTDHTANLRNSISVNINTMQLYPAGTDPGILNSVAKANEEPVIDIEGDDYRAVLSAGMEYAIWVELKEGYWVLTGAIDKFEPLIERYFAEYLHVENLDLEQIAGEQHLRNLERKVERWIDLPM